MTVPVAEWGRRLSDAIRAALDAGDLALARRLAAEGDGQARNLAKEYALMYRGLGITIRVLLPLLRGAADRTADPAAARAEVADLLRRFQADMMALAAHAQRAAGAADPAGDGTLDGEIARATRLLDGSEEGFDQEQHRLAREVLSALDAGDAARARALVDRKEQVQYVPAHDRLIRLMAESFGWVLRRLGPDGLLAFHLATAEGQRRGFEKWEEMTPAEFAWTTAFLLKQHMGRVEVREDGERFTIAQAPCGSGGRLRIAGAYEGAGALPFVEAAGPLTFGRPNLPVYCSHCPAWNAVATIRWFGRPHWVFEDAARPDGACTLHVYKRRDRVPREYVDLLTVPAAGAAETPGR